MSKKKEKLPENFWNNRVVRHTVKRPGGSSETWLEIHEAHYTSKKPNYPRLITSGGVTVVGENRKELRETLKRMLRAVDKPILNYRKFYTKKQEHNLREQGLI